MNAVATLIGFRFFERSHSGRWELRLSWAEITGGFGLALALCLFEDHYSLHVSLGWPNIFIKLPILQRWHREPRQAMESWGFTLFDYNSVHLNWGLRCKIIYFPWAWEWVRTSYLLADGATWAHDLRGFRDHPLCTERAGSGFSRFTSLRDNLNRWQDKQPYR